MTKATTERKDRPCVALRAVWLVLAMFAVPVQVPAQDTSWGSLSLRFVYEGRPPPRPKEITITKDRHAFGRTIEDESLVVNSKNGGIANVVVYLLPAENDELRVHPCYRATANAKKTVIMRRGRFEPHILLLRTSQTMVQKNMDKVAHNANIVFFQNRPM